MRHDRGITLVEACAVLAVCAVLLAAAVPSMQRLIERQKLRGTADELRTDLQFMRAAAVARGEVVWLGVQRDSGGSCYVVYAGDRGNCGCMPNGESRCTGNTEVLKSAGFDARSPVQLQSTTALVGIEPVRGMATPTVTLQLASRSGESVHEVVNVMGRIRACSPGGTVPGFQAC